MRDRLLWLLLWIGSLQMTALANIIAPINILFGGMRGKEVAKSNDAALNAALGGNWKMTVSRHVAIARQAGKWWGRWACRILDFFASGHCSNMLKDPEND